MVNRAAAYRIAGTLFLVCTVAGCGKEFAFLEPDNSLREAYPAEELHASETVAKEISLFSQELKKQRPNQLNSDFVSKGLMALAGKDLIGANLNFQRALKYEPQNASLHMLNGLTHQLRGETGDPEQYNLAEVAYGLAARMDPGDSRVPYLNGVLRFRQQQYRQAQELFATAAELDPQRAEYLIGLAASSYYLGELDRAFTTVEKAQTLSPQNPAALLTGGVIYAALGDFEKAIANYDRLGELSPIRQDYLQRRITDWRKYYDRQEIKSDPVLQSRLAQDLDVFGVPKGGMFDATGSSNEDPLSRGDADAPTTVPSFPGTETADPAPPATSPSATKTPAIPPSATTSSQPPSTGGSATTTQSTAPSKAATTTAPKKAGTAAGAKPAAKPAAVPVAKPVKKAPPKMALIDVAIIRTEEIFRTSKGVNLLNGLNIFFSGAAFRTFKTPFGIGQIRTPLTVNDVLTLQLGTAGAGLTYSLNIFSNTYDRNEVIARPTILVEDQKKSSFFSGTTLHIVLEGGVAGSGSLQPINIGVKLEVTPKFLDDDTVDLSVFAQRSFLEAGLSQVSDTITGTSFAQTSKTTISANLALRYGETMVLSGLSEQEKELLDDKVPGVGDLPVAQYLFRNQRKLSQKKTVLILLTPRKAGLSYQDGTPRVSDGEPKTGKIDKLERSTDWMRPAPNLRAFVKHLGKYEFFNQYRKGDMKLEDWSGEGNIDDAIIRTLDFLYIYYDIEKSDKSEL